MLKKQKEKKNTKLPNAREKPTESTFCVYGYFKSISFFFVVERMGGGGEGNAFDRSKLTAIDFVYSFFFAFMFNFSFSFLLVKLSSLFVYVCVCVCTFQEEWDGLLFSFSFHSTRRLS